MALSLNNLHNINNLLIKLKIAESNHSVYLAVKQKYNEYLKLIENLTDGHLQSCLQFVETGDVTDSCYCYYYINTYPKDLVKELVYAYIEYGEASDNVPDVLFHK